MLFSYQLLENHPIYRFQEWLDHLVQEVWCRQDGDYSIDLLHSDLKTIVEDLGNDDAVKINHLDGPIKTIDALMRHLSPEQRQQVSQWYDNNNEIEALCANDPAKPPGTYADIECINQDLAKELKTFCKSLFTDVIHLSAVRRRLNTSIDEHYQDFVKVNKQSKCPYCGLFPLDGEHDETRDAYDHFLPKGIYPFNTVNFRNLAPMCGKCNSGYKLQKNPVCHLDPIRRKTGNARRRAFYSYATAQPGIQVAMKINTKNAQNLQPTEIELTLIAPGKEEEVESWLEVFGIEQRYKARCCAENDGKAWLGRVTEEHENYGLTQQAMLEAEMRAAENKPWSDANFLKKPFLEACQNAGLI